MNVAVYMGSTPGSDAVYVQKARELGQWMGKKYSRLEFRRVREELR